jgi:hypothetical protein
VRFVELATLADAAVPQPAAALSIREMPTQLVTTIIATSERHLLVLLDNCEHLPGVPSLPTLLRACQVFTSWPPVASRWVSREIQRHVVPGGPSGGGYRPTHGQ